MKSILIACEESQAVTIAFRAQGHLAFSCDLQECSGGHPEWHIMGDCTPLLNGNCSFTTQDGAQHKIFDRWDIIIAHPPCTYLSNAGACRMYRIIDGKRYIDNNRYENMKKARAFFFKFLNADCDKIAVENPTPLKICDLPPATQVIQPYQFGHPYSKRTCLWLKGLPLLNPTKIMDNWRPYLPSGTHKNAGTDKNKGAANGSVKRSKTFKGIADAMAAQWGDI